MENQMKFYDIHWNSLWYYKYYVVVKCCVVRHVLPLGILQSSKPICSIRSASSNTTKVQRFKLQPFIFTMSMRRPGVAMTISLPPDLKKRCDYALDNYDSSKTEYWFRWFSFSIGWCSGSMLKLQECKDHLGSPVARNLESFFCITAFSETNIAPDNRPPPKGNDRLPTSHF